MTADALVHEKLDQAAEILREQDVDVWLTFVRETLLTSDPSLDLIAGAYCAWQGAFLVSRTGERIAIVGRFDAPSVEQTGAYGEVHGYDESIRPALRSTLERLAPRSIARQLLGERPGSRRAHARALARAAEDARGHSLSRSPRVLREDRQRAPRSEVGVGGRANPRCRPLYRGDLREHHRRARTGDERARDRRRDAGGGLTSRARVRVGGRALPGGQRRTRRRRSGTARPAISARAVASCCMPTSASRKPTTAATSSGSGISSTRVRRSHRRTSRPRGAHSGPRSTRGRRRSVRVQPAGRWTRRPASSSSRPASRNRCTPSAISSAGRRMTAARSSGLAGTGTGKRRWGSSRTGTCTRWNSDRSSRPRLHRARGERPRHGRRHRMAEHAAARALARRLGEPALGRREVEPAAVATL